MEGRSPPNSPACGSPQPHSPVSPCAAGTPAEAGGGGERPPHPEPGWCRGAGAGPPWPGEAGLVRRGCSCPVGKAAVLTGRPVSLFAGHSQAFPERWGLGGPPIPPLGASPVIQRRRGHHVWGDNDPNPNPNHGGTVPSSGSLSVPGEAAVPGQNQSWHGSPPPPPCGSRPPAPLQPWLCTGGSSPPSSSGGTRPERVGAMAVPPSHRPGIPARCPPARARGGSSVARPGALPAPGTRQGRNISPPCSANREGEGTEGRGTGNARPSPAPPAGRAML